MSKLLLKRQNLWRLTRTSHPLRCVETVSSPHAATTRDGQPNRRWITTGVEAHESLLRSISTPAPALSGSQQGIGVGPSKSSPGRTGLKEALLSHSLIRYGADKTVSKSPTQEQLQQLVTAEKFFEHGSGSRFLYSAASDFHHTPNQHIPEVVVLGASNVGKSSFLNALLGKPGAAHVSQKPGRTRLLNAFGVGPPAKMAPGLVRPGDKPPQHSLVVMDTPGYGYKSQKGWGDAIIKYVRTRKMLRGAVVLLSAEKRLLQHDKWLLRTLAENDTRTMIVITKADKGRKDWVAECGALGQDVRNELQRIERSLKSGWREGSGWVPDLYITAANMDIRRRLGNGGGMGGARLAILEMAGFSALEKVEQKAETVTYTGSIVPFDDIVWKE